MASRDQYRRRAWAIAAYAQRLEVDDLPAIPHLRADRQDEARRALLETYRALTLHMAEQGSTRWHEAGRTWAAVAGVPYPRLRRHLPRLEAFGLVRVVAVQPKGTHARSIGRTTIITDVSAVADRLTLEHLDAGDALSKEHKAAPRPMPKVRAMEQLERDDDLRVGRIVHLRCFTCGTDDGPDLGYVAVSDTGQRPRYASRTALLWERERAFLRPIAGEPFTFVIAEDRDDGTYRVSACVAHRSQLDASDVATMHRDRAAFWAVDRIDTRKEQQ